MRRCRSLGGFWIPFTGYIDGVKQSETDLGAPEDRLPPGGTFGNPPGEARDQYHWNVYQPGAPLDPFEYHGTDVEGAAVNDNVEVEDDNPDDDIYFDEGITHGNIDNAMEVQDHLMDRLRARVDKW